MMMMIITTVREIRVEFDHKALVTIFTKPLVSAPKRLQKMLFRLD